MVKIKLKLFLLSILVLALLASTAYAESKLFFSDVDVKVGGKSSKNLVDGETIDEEAEPGDNVVFDIEVKSNFTDEEDLKIKDVTVEVTIESIDEDGDLEEESKEFDLDPGEDKNVKVEFEVPLEVEEDTFNVIIRASGEDENGTDHDVRMDLDLEVNKESHKIVFTRNTLTPADITCARKNVQAGVTLVNIGNEDEEDITFNLENSDLGLDLSESIEELTAEPNEDESRFSKTFTFNVPEDTDAGSYLISFSASYDNGRKHTEETSTLSVNDCLTNQEEDAGNEGEEEQSGDSTVTVITPPPTTGSTTTTPDQTAIPEGTVVTQEGSLLSGNTFVIGIIVAEVLIVLVGIVLFVVLVVRK